MIPVLAGVGALSSAVAVGLMLWIVGAWCWKEIRRQQRRHQQRRADRQRLLDALRRTKSPTYPLPHEPRMTRLHRRRDW